jgi:hypothetical protein
MLQRFVELKPSMQTVYSDQKETFPVKKGDDEVISDMISSLVVVERAVEMISAEGATLLDAEYVLQVLFIGLSSK